MIYKIKDAIINRELIIKNDLVPVETASGNEIIIAPKDMTFWYIFDSLLKKIIIERINTIKKYSLVSS
jgi:hypothetical protein